MRFVGWADAGRPSQRKARIDKEVRNMTTVLEPLDAREEALASLGKKRDFRTHLLTYLLVNGFLWLIWGVVYAVTDTWFPWPVFPLFGWGIGLIFHAWDTYWRRPFSEAEITREVARLASPQT
jgi:uncharacterized membrane protein